MQHATSDGVEIAAHVIADRARGLTSYDRMIFGHFIEHFHTQVYGGLYWPGSPLSDGRGFRTDVIDVLREIKLPIMRWPGGNFVSDYHWRDAVGPNRSPNYNMAWRVPEPNTFGTDEFIAWCREVGAEPYICTNGGNGTPQEMSDWVEYCNGQLDTKNARLRRQNGSDRPFGVRYWGIGNESYGDWQVGAKTIAEWGPYVAESAKMMRNVDPDIVLSAAAVPDLDWTLALLRAAGRHLDLISIHGYWDQIHQVDTPADYLTCMLRAEEPEELIEAAESVVAVSGFKDKIGIAFDEWNLRGWHHPNGNSEEAILARNRNDLASTYTMADALFSAGFLNACLRHADTVRMANISPTINTRGPLFVHETGIVKRTTFHVMKMYVDLLRRKIADAAVLSDRIVRDGKSVAVLDAVVSADTANGSATLMLVNRDPVRSVQCKVTLDRADLEGTFPAVFLSGDSPDAFNEIAAPERVVPTSGTLTFRSGAGVIPPHTLVAVTVA
jgi:alpha-N-arabinofuranosidase